MATTEKKTRQQVAIPGQELGSDAWSEAERPGPLGPDRAQIGPAPPLDRRPNADVPHPVALLPPPPR
jgi:hypothetical protein